MTEFKGIMKVAFDYIIENHQQGHQLSDFVCENLVPKSSIQDQEIFLITFIYSLGNESKTKETCVVKLSKKIDTGETQVLGMV